MKSMRKYLLSIAFNLLKLDVFVVFASDARGTKRKGNVPPDTDAGRVAPRHFGPQGNERRDDCRSEPVAERVVSFHPAASASSAANALPGPPLLEGAKPARRRKPPRSKATISALWRLGRRSRVIGGSPWRVRPQRSGKPQRDRRRLCGGKTRRAPASER
jgi:hypothetical protein